MPRPALHLAVLSLLAGAAVQAIRLVGLGEVDISSCPVTYFGQTYDKIHIVQPLTETFAVSFNGSFSGDPDGLDYIRVGAAVSTRIETTINTTEIPVGSGLHAKLPSAVAAPVRCNVTVVASFGLELVRIEIYSFGKQAALRLSTSLNYGDIRSVIKLNIKTKGGSISQETLPSYGKTVEEYRDLSGCRRGDQVYPVNKVLGPSDPDSCLSETCDVTGGFTSVSACGSEAWCEGGNRCFPSPTMCTVTGSSVIDFHRRARPRITSRCGYALIQPHAAGGNGSAFAVVAVFRERRRKDFPLLDRVDLVLTDQDMVISLEQGGRVQVNGEPLSVSSRPQVVCGVELSKTEAGVTAKIPHEDHEIPLFFDGFTAQIDMTGYKGPNVFGLCGDLHNHKDSPGENTDDITPFYPDPGCETQYNDTADSSIDCDAMTTRCNLLRQEPFTACNRHISPEPYISACADTMCRYPAVDGVLCQLMEAYARTCRSHSNDPLTGWREKAQCSASPKASCQDKFCASHEFCGEATGSPGSGNTCLCRALFTSTFKSGSSFGEQTVCGQHHASLSLPGCLLEEQHIDHSVLHLNDQTCRGTIDNVTHMVTFSYDMRNSSCGTVVTVNDTHLLYRNAVLMRGEDASDMITRQNKVEIGFSCFYTQPEIMNSKTIKPQQSPVKQQMVSGPVSYSLIMNIYTDPERKNAITSSTEIPLDQRIWVELKTEGLEDNRVAVVTESCWATDRPSSNGSLTHDLIIKGCANPADPTVKVEKNGQGTSSYFSFNMFQFSGKTSDVYLHCKLRLCTKRGKACVTHCGGPAARRRRRSPRSTYEDQNPVLITMAWTN